MKKFFFVLLLLTLAMPAWGAGFNNTSGPWGIDAGGFKNFSTALASPHTVGKTLVVSKAMTINNKTVGGNRRVVVTPDGRITVASGKTLAFGIDSSFEAGSEYVFNGAGSVTGLKEAYPENFVQNVTPGTTDMLGGFNKAKAAAKIIRLSETTYGVSDEIAHLTADALVTVPVANGIQILGRSISGTVIKALAGFPAGKALLNLDGNNAGSVSAVAQNFDTVKNLTLDCNNVADRGLRMRAVWYSTFEDLVVKNAAGGAADALIVINGMTTPGDDDVDTSARCTFRRLTIRVSTGHGVLGVDGRCASMVFEDCDIRSCLYDGMRISFANLHLKNVTFGSNGKAADTSTGGFTAAKSATGAVNRGLSMIGCQYENNWNHEINLDWCYGFEISGGLLTPYTRAASGQAIARFGTGTNEVEGGTVSGLRIAIYSTTGPIISGMTVGAAARNIAFNNLSYDLSGSTWDTTAEQFTVAPDASAITYNGKDIASYPQTTRFAVTPFLGSVHTNVTGDGTEYTLATFEAEATTYAAENFGPLRQSHYIGAASISDTTLTVATITGTPLQVGNRVTGTDVLPNTFITAILSGSGGAGNYTVSRSQTVSSRVMKAWDTQWYSMATGIFTAPANGLYRFESYWPCTGFSGSEADVEVALTVNPGGTPVRHIVSKQAVSSLTSGLINIYGGSRVLPLKAGDQVTTSLKISGGTKVVDIYRDFTAGGWTFSGAAL